jgi:cob(I)alamin adenosyltransferase
MSRLGKGLVHVYTGEGKGKTTAALGQTWRALGAGLRVYFLQFLKGGTPSSEALLAERFAPQLVFRHLAHPCTPQLLRGEPTEVDCQYARRAWQIAQEVMADPQWDLVVLDEINNTVYLGLVRVEELLTALRRRPSGMEVICTGRHAPPALLEYADLVTEMVAVKHPHQAGVAARRGIEY